MATLTETELKALKTGDEVYAVIQYTDDDGSKSIYFAGRTALTVYDYPSGERSYSPDARPELDFNDLSLEGDRFQAEDWECVLCSDSDSARAELTIAQARLIIEATKHLEGIDAEFVD